MEKDKVLMHGGENRAPTWNSCNFGMEMQTNELNCLLSGNWDNSMDQSDPFESALSSMVCSPAASDASGDNVMIRELIGRLGNVTNSADISTSSCYTTPLNSPPKLNLSTIDSQMRGSLNLNSQGPGNQLPFSADPGFAERAARFSSFGGLGFVFSQKLVPNLASAGSEKKNTRLSRSSSPENAEESSISEQIQKDANSRKRKSIPRGIAKETPSPAAAAANAKVSAEKDESAAKRSKQDGAEAGKTEQKGNGKTENDENQKANKEKENYKATEAPKDYIHVRARRGQATDSHSLAERVRREKISERMKFLQDLVPGCNKVTGKAVMLDEIINYVQSLQQQVEFLSMKLATVNPRMDTNLEAILSKDMFQSRGSLPHTLYSMDSSTPAFPFGYQPQQQGLLPLSSGLSYNTDIHLSMNPLNAAALRKTQGLQLPPVDGYTTDANPQVWEDDLQSIVQMGFGQNQPPSYQALGQVKIEL